MSDCIKTLCPYCGVGCGLEVVSVKNPGQPDQAPSWKVRGDRTHPSSQGMVCVKGATAVEPLDKDRLLYPMMRESLDQPFQRVSWDQALDRIVCHVQKVCSTSGADALCMYGSGQFQTEDYYVAQKLMKGCLGTNNFDANSRLCMSSAVAGYLQSFGADGPPCCYDDLEQTDCAFLIGTNTAECHPIVFNRLRKHHKQTAQVKLVVVDPRRTQTAEVADLHLAIRPGTDIDLLNGIAHLLVQWGKLDQTFIADHTTGFAEYADVVQHYPPEVVAWRCGITVEDLETAARYWAESDRVLSLWSMGVNQSTEGTAKVRTIINLHLMTGMIGKPGSGPFSLTGQPNAMGGREAGGLSHLLPGYRSVTNPDHRTAVEQFWKLPPGRISPHRGRSTWDIITGLETGDVEFVWIAATNPVVSLPDLERTKAALRRSPLTVYQDAYHPTETTAYAHILLPAAQWSEKAGCMTNSERVVTYCPAFRTPPGEARPDWEIFADVGRRLGFETQFAFQNSADVYAEFVQLTRDRPCDHSQFSHQRLSTEGPLQWSNPKKKEEKIEKKEEKIEEDSQTIQSSTFDLLSSKQLYSDRRFHTLDGRARFGAYHSRGLAEPSDTDYPFVFTNGRLYGHWHTQSRTGRIEKLRQMHPTPFLEIHPRDAAKQGIVEGDLVEVRSRRGVARFPAKVTQAIAPGTVFAPMHWGSLWAEGAEINNLTHSEACPDSLEPELKACAVQVCPVGLRSDNAGSHNTQDTAALDAEVLELA
ncbi:MAG: nitrate reductase [Oculatellaceae cyanobacterium bins.114]|nr:nitrate reductase [Oculatellaceae cyanobacterium bins.114]